MSLLVIFFSVSIVFSFLCSVWEAVILSVTPSFVSRKIHEGHPIGPLLSSYKTDIDRPLSAILSLNTIAHTVGAIGVGAQAGLLFGTTQIDLGITSVSYESVIAGAMTLAILFLSEIIPKTIGANKWRQLVPFTVRSIRMLIIILWPLVYVSQRITRSLKNEKGRSVLSRADFTAMTLVGEQSGALDAGESTIIQNLLRLDTLKVRDVMTPRNVMLMAQGSTTLSSFDEKNKSLPFSRIPIFQDKPDNVTGIILKNELLRAIADDQGTKTLKDLRRDVQFIKDSEPLTALLDALVKQRTHIAIVVDNYGSVVGLVTMEDLFETILGFEIIDESDSIPNLQSFARKQWESRAKRIGLIPGDTVEPQE